jgi:hypothetical protein
MGWQNIEDRRSARCHCPCYSTQPVVQFEEAVERRPPLVSKTTEATWRPMTPNLLHRLNLGTGHVFPLLAGDEK